MVVGDSPQYEMKRCSLLGRKVMTNLDSIFKSRDITLPTLRLSRAGGDLGAAGFSHSGCKGRERFPPSSIPAPS